MVSGSRRVTVYVSSSSGISSLTAVTSIICGVIIMLEFKCFLFDLLQSLALLQIANTQTRVTATSLCKI